MSRILAHLCKKFAIYSILGVYPLLTNLFTTISLIIWFTIYSKVIIEVIKVESLRKGLCLKIKNTMHIIILKSSDDTLFLFYLENVSLLSSIFIKYDCMNYLLSTNLAFNLYKSCIGCLLVEFILSRICNDSINNINIFY